jgi:hypothetical protein
VGLEGASSTTFLGEFWTLNTSEFPRDAVVSSLSQVLAPVAPPKYFLSPKACAGILRRAEKRKKKLPALLGHCLRTVAGWSAQPETPTSSISAFLLLEPSEADQESVDGPTTSTVQGLLFP